MRFPAKNIVSSDCPKKRSVFKKFKCDISKNDCQSEKTQRGRVYTLDKRLLSVARRGAEVSRQKSEIRGQKNNGVTKTTG